MFSLDVDSVSAEQRGNSTVHIGQSIERYLQANMIQTAHAFSG